MKKKKYLSILLSIIIILLMFSGCKGADGEVGGQDKEKGNGAEQGKKEEETEKKEDEANDKDDIADKGLPLADAPTTLVVAAQENWYSEAPLASGLSGWKEIEDKTNVVIEWETPSDFFAAMRTRLAAGSDLPDIMRAPDNPTVYGMEGLLIPINDYIEKHGHNIKKVFEQYEHSRELMTSADGNMYGLASITIESRDVNTPTFFVRQDWLNKLGLKEPDTVEDWYEMLRAFKEQDPNENGEEDEVPFAGSLYSLLGGAYDLHLVRNDGGFREENGQVTYQWADPKLKDLLEMANKFHREELYGSGAGHGDERIANNQIGSMNRAPDLIPNDLVLLRDAGYENAVWIPTKPPQGPKGDRLHVGYGFVTSGYMSITKDCKDPELAFKFMDYMWSEEGIRYMAWGVEGETYVMEDGKPKFTDFVLNNPDGLGPVNALRTTGAWPTVSWIQQADTYTQLHSVVPELAQIPEKVTPYLVEPFPPILPSPAEEKRLNELQGDIEAYRAEMVGKFLTGEESLDQFDEYLRTLKDKGLDEVLEIKQKQYDRVFK